MPSWNSQGLLFSPNKSLNSHILYLLRKNELQCVDYHKLVYNSYNSTTNEEKRKKNSNKLSYEVVWPI